MRKNILKVLNTRKMGKVVLGAVVAATLSLNLLACNKVSNTDFDKVMDKTEAGYTIKEDVAEKATEKISVRNRSAVYTDMHEIANSMVIAEDKWGEQKVTEEKVNALLVEVSASDFPNKKDLIEILTAWKDGDFSNVDADHNYIWKQLGGTVGMATGVDEAAIPTWAKDKQNQNQNQKSN